MTTDRSTLVRAARRIVVKVGSSSLTTAAGGIDPARVRRLVEVLATARGTGAEMLGRRGEDQRFDESRPAAQRRRDIDEAMEDKEEHEARADVARRLDEQRAKKGPNRSTGSSGVGPMAYEIGSKDDPDWDGSDD